MCLVLELGISPNTELGISLQPQPLTRFGALILCIHRHWLSSRLPLASPCCPGPSTPATPPLPLRRRPSPSTPADPLPFPLWRRPPPLPPRWCKPEARRRPFHSARRPLPFHSGGGLLPFHLDGASKKQGDAPFHSSCGHSPSTLAAAPLLLRQRCRSVPSPLPRYGCGPFFLAAGSQQKIDLSSFLRF